ncbi:MAG: hypothetical protein Q4G60_10605 [bacterium]|nr:hypothetical protein [bacterium]
MTNEEASIIVGNIPIIPDDCYSIEEYQQAKAMAIGALEKQIPKKPYYVQYDVNPKIGNWHCPICNSICLHKNYPCQCGQKLDWSV